MKRSWLMAVLVVLTASVVRAETYSIDPAHSSVQFRIKHVVGKVTGHFDKYSGTFTYTDGKPQTWNTQATIEATSINTGIEKRDNHLRSPDFFDVAKYPTLTFKSTGVTDLQGNTGKLHGDLTLHGVTRPIVLTLQIEGSMKDPMGKMRAGAEATGSINRNDFGVGPSSGTMAGMVGQSVEITIDVEGVK